MFNNSLIKSSQNITGIDIELFYVDLFVGCLYFCINLCNFDPSLNMYVTLFVATLWKIFQYFSM